MQLYVDDDFFVETRPENKGNSLYNKLVAISQSLAKVQINWTVEQKKLFTMCITKIAWSKSGNSNIIKLDKKEIIEALGLKIDSRNQSAYLRKAFQKLSKNSWIYWTNPEDKDEWDDGVLITNWKSTRGSIFVTFNQYFMPLLENLAKSYVTFLSNDIFNFSSKFTFALFEDLRIHCDTRRTNFRTYTTKELKDLFGLSENNYVSNGKFDRYNFEKRCLDKAIAEINQSEMMSIYPSIGNHITNSGETKFYEKLKKNGHIIGYRLKYVVKTKKTKPLNVIND